MPAVRVGEVGREALGLQEHPARHGRLPEVHRHPELPEAGRPQPRRCAASESPYGPAPTMATSMASLMLLSPCVCESALSPARLGTCGSVAGRLRLDRLRGARPRRYGARRGSPGLAPRQRPGGQRAIPCAGTSGRTGRRSSRANHAVSSTVRSDASQDRSPSSPLAPVAEGPERVVVLHQEAAPAHLLARRGRLAGQVEVLGSDHVDARGVAEQPELGAEPRIEVEQLVLAVPGVQAQVKVEDPAVRQISCSSRGDLVAQPGVRSGAAEAGQPGVGRVGPFLDPGERRPAPARWRRQ